MSVRIQDINRLLGIQSPWEVSEIKQDDATQLAEIHVICSEGSVLRCPECNKVCPGYDHRFRKWRHTDICEYQTTVVAKVPRVECSEHGIKTVSVPWADERVRFTTAFEAKVINGLLDATSISTVATRMGVSWTMIANIMERAVLRGRARKKEELIAHLCVDETSYKKGHNYITVVSNPDTATVLYVGEGRTKASLKGYYDGRSAEQLEAIESVSMDMWPAYISVTKTCVPNAEKKIAFDHFHVAKYISDAVDKVRRQENRELRKEDNYDLTGTKYDWLTNPKNMSARQKKRFNQLKTSSLKTARAWAIKELSQNLWHYVHPTWALKGWKRWLSWAMRCRLEPMKDAAKTIKNHLWGIINAVILKVSNGPAESINSRIKTVKIRARGFRNKQRFINAIYFYLGGLDLYPEGFQKQATHS